MTDEEYDLEAYYVDYEETPEDLADYTYPELMNSIIEMWYSGFDFSDPHMADLKKALEIKNQRCDLPKIDDLHDFVVKRNYLLRLNVELIQTGLFDIIKDMLQEITNWQNWHIENREGWVLSEQPIARNKILVRKAEG